jgi:O-antigen/teichoic acid export membrane protein/aminoglycoside phosphotransferase (APT) family kinase protein
MTVMQFVAGARRRVAGLWRQPLHRTGHLLVANSMLNAGTGVAYWVLAARLNPPAVVGVSTAAISAMMLLAGASQLNLMSAILRFVPTAGRVAGRMIRGSYLIGGGLAGVAAAGFLAGLRHWAPSLVRLLHPGLGYLGFVVATMFWSVFVMQDNALVAVRRPAAVPAENLSFAVLKIILVVMLSLAVPGVAIWLSWTGAMIIAVGGTTVYLFWRAVPAFSRASAPESAHVASIRELTRYIGPDYVGGLAYLAATSLVPLLVLDLTNPRQSAAFALAWQVCAALYAVPIAFGQSLVAHGAVQRQRLDEYHRQALRQSLRLLVPVVVLVVVLAPVGLRFFGAWYAAHGVATLRLLALSALPNAVMALEVSRARVARRMSVVVTVLVSLTVLVLGLVVLLVPRLGIVGGGIAWLGGQLGVAAVVAGCHLAGRVRARMLRSGEAGVPERVIGAALAARGWQPEQRLPTLSDSAVVMVRARDGEPGMLKVAASGSGVASLQREYEVLNRLRSDDRLGRWRALLPEPLAAGEVVGGAYLLTRRLPGRDGGKLQPEPMRWLTPAAASIITPLHRLAASVAVVDSPLLQRLVDQPAELLRRTVGHDDRVDRLVSFLHTQLAGRWVTLGWVHGDFYPGNVLVSEGGLITGVIDWTQAREHDLPVLDIAFWLLTVPCLMHGHGLGSQVAARLTAGRCWSPAESQLLAAHSDGDRVSQRALLLLAWLRHVTDNLDKSDRYAGSARWTGRNVLPVLRLIADLDEEDAGVPA